MDECGERTWKRPRSERRKDGMNVRQALSTQLGNLRFGCRNAGADGLVVAKKFAKANGAKGFSYLALVNGNCVGRR
jgi:hypothetical protein